MRQKSNNTPETGWVRKEVLGVHIIPEQWQTFQKIALAQRKSTSVLLSLVIDESIKTGFEIYNVAPKYGEITDATTLTTLNILPEQKNILKEWAQKAACSISKVVRCLVDYTVENFKGTLPEDNEAMIPLYFFEMCIDHNLQTDEIVANLLKDFSKANISGLLADYHGDGSNLIDGEFDFSDDQKALLKKLALDYNLSDETVFLAFILYIRQISTLQIFRNCYVPKTILNDYKRICGEVFSTVSLMLNSHVNTFSKRSFNKIVQKFGQNDDDLQRINFNMAWRTKLILEGVCKRNSIKMSEAIRLLMCTSYEMVSKFDTEKIRRDIMQQHK